MPNGQPLLQRDGRDLKAASHEVEARLEPLRGMPLLRTKLLPPLPRAQLVARERLFARLDQGAQRRLTIIAAPAGSGKSSLLCAWLEHYPGGIGWLSLDAADNDPRQFWAYLLAALAMTSDAVAALVPELLRDGDLPSPDLLLTPILNAAAQVEHPAVLVLDDYHAITTPAVQTGMRFLVDHLPPQLHLVLASRADPPWPMARLRARDEIVELRAADLRFTTEEAGQFLGEVMGLRLTPAAVARLEARTEGWITGLQLAALSLRGRSDPEAFIEAFGGSHRYIVDYLMEEVLGQLDEPTRRFLLETAILDRLCGPLCDAVVGGAPLGSSQQRLEELDAANLFVIPLDDERHWYRYHHLFAEVLRARTRQADPAGTRERHRRASSWFAEAGFLAEATETALDGEDWDRAAALLEAAYRPLINGGQQFTLRRWLERLPNTVRAAHPWLTVNYSWVLLFLGEVEAHSAPLALAEATWQAEGNDHGLGEIVRVRAQLARLREDAAGAVEHGRAAITKLDKDNAPLWSSAAAALGKGLVLQGDLDTAEAILAEARAMTVEGTITRLLIDNLFGDIAVLRGDPDAAIRIYQSVLQRGGERPLWQLVEARLGLAGIALARGELAQAKELVQAAIELAQQTGRAIFLARAYLTLAQIEHTQGNPAAARETLVKAMAIAEQLGNARALAEAEAIFRARSRNTSQQPTSHPNLGSSRSSALLLVEPLSEREQDVLALLVAGCSNQEIAEWLFVSVGTVKTHLKHLYDKLEVHSRTQAVARAREFGLH